MNEPISKMNVTEVRLSNFERMVINEAEQKRNARLLQLADEKEKMTAELEREIAEKFGKEYTRATLRITKKKNEHLFQLRLKYQQQLLGKRQQLIDDLFANVAKRLEQFALSEGYKGYLEKGIARCKAKLEGATDVILCERDAKYQSIAKGHNLAATFVKNDIIGGFMLIDKASAVRLDSTLQSKLEDAKAKFLERYNIRI